jgi:hypothetical protein
MRFGANPLRWWVYLVVGSHSSRSGSACGVHNEVVGASSCSSVHAPGDDPSLANSISSSRNVGRNTVHGICGHRSSPQFRYFDRHGDMTWHNLSDRDVRDQVMSMHRLIAHANPASPMNFRSRCFESPRRHDPLFDKVRKLVPLWGIGLPITAHPLTPRCDMVPQTACRSDPPEWLPFCESWQPKADTSEHRP